MSRLSINNFQIPIKLNKKFTEWKDSHTNLKQINSLLNMLREWLNCIFQFKFYIFSNK